MGDWEQANNSLDLGQGATDYPEPQSPPGQPVDTRSAESLPTATQKFCLFILCADFLSGFANDFSSRFLHTTSYVSAVTAVLLPIAVLMSGNARRGLKLSLGWWWIAFGAWLAICAPFSIWISSTGQLLANYYFRTYLLYFAICACAVNSKQLTKLMYTLAASTGLIVMNCIAFGFMSSDSRFAVHDSPFSFLSNSNELALALLAGILILVYPFFQERRAAQLVSVALIPFAAMYMLKTGSRGVFLAVGAVLFTAFLLSNRKVRSSVLTVLLVVLAAVTVPTSTRQRLLDIQFGVDDSRPPTADSSAHASQTERENLLRQSVSMTLHHPIFGVGPGQFAVARWGLITAHGEWGQYFGTHNSYTEISSEAGIPAFIFYLTTIIVCLRLNYRMYRQTAGREALRNYAGLSFCMLLSIVLYAVSTFFFHIAYSSYLPTIAGITGATRLALDRVLLDASKPKLELLTIHPGTESVAGATPIPD